MVWVFSEATVSVGNEEDGLILVEVIGVVVTGILPLVELLFEPIKNKYIIL